MDDFHQGFFSELSKIAQGAMVGGNAQGPGSSPNMQQQMPAAPPPVAPTQPGPTPTPPAVAANTQAGMGAVRP